MAQFRTVNILNARSTSREYKINGIKKSSFKWLNYEKQVSYNNKISGLVTYGNLKRVGIFRKVLITKVVEPQRKTPATADRQNT